MLKSNSAFHAVHFMEVVCISKGPLREVPLYIYYAFSVNIIFTLNSMQLLEAGQVMVMGMMKASVEELLLGLSLEYLC